MLLPDVPDDQRDTSVPAQSTLLVVEDEPMIARILEHKLRREGWAVRVCGSAAAAEAALRAEPADAALIDATLELDGLAWAEGLAAAGLSPRHGWLALVEARDPGAPGRAHTHGAAGVVIKPFKPTVVAAELRRLVDAGHR
jgi:DNA-binding response OmpR family regulator